MVHALFTPDSPHGSQKRFGKNRGAHGMSTTIYVILTLLVLIIAIAIISTRAAQKRNRTTKLDNEIFRRNDE
jgi:uncharacterized DUF497 family protein